MNHMTNVQLGVLVLVVLLVGMALMHMITDIRRRNQKSRESQEALRKTEHAERELRQKRDHQLNYGRQVFNKLSHQLKQYRELGIKLSKKEDNGTGFSIYIIRESTAVMQGWVPILQLTYDFVEYQAPYQGHINYGAYGPDILVWVGDHAPMAGLDRLVVKVVEEEADRIKVERAETLARMS